MCDKMRETGVGKGGDEGEVEVRVRHPGQKHMIERQMQTDREAVKQTLGIQRDRKQSSIFSDRSRQRSRETEVDM